MKNQIEDLRNHLFAALEALSDADKPMEIDRARAIADVGKTIIESAKVEVDYLKVTGAIRGSAFMAGIDTAPEARQLGAGTAPIKPPMPIATPLRTCASCHAKVRRDPCDRCGSVWNRPQ